MFRPEEIEREKHAAAAAAALLVTDQQRVGLGTGSTVAYLLPVLAARDLDIVCVATSPATEDAARALGLRLEPYPPQAPLDIAIDGADQIGPGGWIVKGGGGAHRREKRVAKAAERFVVIASWNKVVAALAPPVPLELDPDAVDAVVRALGDVTLREVPASPDGGVIADYRGPLGDPPTLAERLDDLPGVLAHGLFQPQLTSDVLVGRGGDVVALRSRS